MDRPSDIEFQPVAVAARGDGRRRMAARRLALVAPVVALAAIVGVAAFGRPPGGPGPEAVIAETPAAPTPTPTPAASPMPATPSVVRARPYWSGELRPPSGEDGLMGGIPFGTAWSWLTDGPNRP